MRQNYLTINKLFVMFLLGFVVAGCGALHNYKAYKGEDRKVEELAVIKGESRVQKRFLSKSKSVSDHILVQVTAVDNEQTSWALSRMPQSVLVEPGRRQIDVRYKNRSSYASGRVLLDAEKGKTYIIKTHIKNYSIIFWIEDEKTGEQVGENPGNEPKNRNVPPPEA